MRLIMTSSRWGNLYRNRFYVNGRRVTERVWAEAREAAGKAIAMKDSERVSYGYRTVWEAL